MYHIGYRLFRSYADETNDFLKSFVPPSGVTGESFGQSETTATDGTALVGHVAVWNPFDDASPFCQMNEDHLFGAEFDKIRRGSQSSKHYFFVLVLSIGYTILLVSL